MTRSTTDPAVTTPAAHDAGAASTLPATDAPAAPCRPAGDTAAALHCSVGEADAASCPAAAEPAAASLPVATGTGAASTRTAADRTASARPGPDPAGPTRPTALIADDEPHLAAFLREALAAAWPELEVVAVARNGVEAAERIAALRPDVAFLDIRMPGLSGLDVAAGIEGETRVVFVTAFDGHAVAAFEQQAFDYVLKPVGLERLRRTVERLQRAIAAPPADDARLDSVLRALSGVASGARWLRHVRADQGELVHQVAVDEVLFFRADDKYTGVRTAAGEYLIRTPIWELAAQLDPQRFAQVHRSTIVNLDRVAGTRRDELSRLFVRLHGHAGELPVSRAYVHRFKAM